MYFLNKRSQKYLILIVSGGTGISADILQRERLAGMYCAQLTIHSHARCQRCKKYMNLCNIMYKNTYYSHKTSYAQHGARKHFYRKNVTVFLYRMGVPLRLHKSLKFWECNIHICAADCTSVIK